jgi:PAS domain S-box-containing protein
MSDSGRKKIIIIIDDRDALSTLLAGFSNKTVVFDSINDVPEEDLKSDTPVLICLKIKKNRKKYLTEINSLLQNVNRSKELCFILEPGWLDIDKEFPKLPESWSVVKKNRFWDSKYVQMVVESLTGERNLFQSVYYESEDAYLLINNNGTIEFANPAAEMLFKKNIEDLINTSFGYPVVKNERTEIQILRSNAGKVHGELRIFDVSWEDDTSKLAVIRDVTAQKKLQEELKNNVRRMETALSTIDQAVLTLDENGIVIQINLQLLKMLQLSEEETVGKDVDDLFSIFQIRSDTSSRRLSFGSLKSKSFGIDECDWKLINSIGMEYWVSFTIQSMRISDMDNGYIFTLRNLNKSHAIRNAYKENEQRYRNVFEQSKIGLLLLSKDLVVRDLNEAFCTLFGLSLESSKYKSILVLQPQMAEFYRSLVHQKQNFLQERLTDRFGKELYCNITVSKITSDDHLPDYFITFRDVSSQVQTQNQLQSELEERSALLSEVFHRSGNSLQLVISILSLYKDDLKGEQFDHTFNSLLGKISTISLVYKQLIANSDISKLKITSLLHAIAAMVSADFPSNADKPDFHLTGDDFSLNVDAAIPLGLCIFEMLNNSFRYSDFSNKEEKAIKCHVLLQDGHVCVLRYYDSSQIERPVIESKNTTPSGLSLIWLLVESQLEGCISFLPGHGYGYEIVFDISIFSERL